MIHAQACRRNHRLRIDPLTCEAIAPAKPMFNSGAKQTYPAAPIRALALRRAGKLNIVGKEAIKPYAIDRT